MQGKYALSYKYFPTGVDSRLAWSYDAASIQWVPTVFIEGHYAFRFYSSDSSEPIHIHVIRDKSEARFWLTPLTLAANIGLSPRELKVVRSIIERRRSEIETRWKEYFNEIQDYC